ncbi:MAG: imidazole glycerol phosphate synthase subunit HisH [Pseudomonadales bacterium]|nr:imidazole glycerol phosphate synthase subunit HisH [Pseudomonadales bacterium]
MAAATAIVDYDAGNLRSVQRACHEVGLDAEIVGDPEALLRASRVIFPGVGAAGAAMRSLKRRGLDTALREVIARGTPTLGICLGLQISLAYSEENETTTLGLIPGKVRRFDLNDPALKVPHMGWNEVRLVRPHPVLAGLEPGDEFYFVHAYYTEPDDRALVHAVSEYEHEFTCALGRDNYFGVQFHPEKSGRVGLRLLSAFATWSGVC